MLAPKVQIASYINPELAAQIPSLLKELDQPSVSKLVEYLLQKASDNGRQAFVIQEKKTNG